MLLQMEWPFKDETTRDAQETVQGGGRPSFYQDVWNSPHPSDQALKQAMLLCHEQDPTNRSSAREVANYLQGQLERQHPGIIMSWNAAGTNKQP